ncbi:MAG: SDR family NAD(P)-dependent oxidoreductase [Planctomycetota bacterium]
MTSQRTALVTGTTSGIGVELAAQLVKAGWELVLINRSRERTKPLIERLHAENPSSQVTVYEADLADQDQVEAAAKQVTSSHPKIDALFNNAGVLRSEPAVSKHGHDLHFQVNVLAAWQLTHLLRPLLSASDERAVVVSASSSAIGMCGPLRIDELSRPKKQGLAGAYGQSKLAVTVAMAMLAEEFRSDGIDLYAVDPGGTRTPMTKGKGAPFFVRWAQFLLPGPDKGAAKLMVPLNPAWSDRSGSLIASGRAKDIPANADSPASRKELRTLLDKAVQMATS